MNRILVIITTEPQFDIAEKISNLLLIKRIAACISLKEITSIYHWDGKVETNKEIEITIKSTPEKRQILTEVLKSELSYDLPQIIFNEFDSDLSYFNWIKEMVI